MIPRIIERKIIDKLFKRKAIVLYGARQVGKTTLIKDIQRKYPAEETLYLNCDEPDIRTALQDATSTKLKGLFGNARLVFIDEAQRVRDIGITIKLCVDNFPERQVVATGSSSLDLSNKVVEPLTGRVYEFPVFPFALAELKGRYADVEMARIVEDRMVFGMYPEVVLEQRAARDLLKNIASSYLYKDILQYQDIRRPELLDKLLKALALQVGSEVSFPELATALGVSKLTVAHYVDLLEKCFVVFRLTPFSRNLRNELTKKCKIYFYDNGIRNALINNFNPVSLRQDAGALWENFMLSERMKANANAGRNVNAYFWRTHQQQEIDYIEDEGGALCGFEFKWGNGKAKIPKSFLAAYPGSETQVVSRENFPPFAGLSS